MSFRVNLEKAAWILVLVLAVLARFYSLGERVISHDESLHTYYSWELSEGRGFQHSPLMHGPFQFHALALSFFLLDDSDFTARVPSALFGVAAVGLLWCLRDWLGRRGALVCAVLMTISPVLLYYSRYVRNEALVVVWVLIMVLSMVRYYGERKAQWLYILAGAMAFNHATKETAFIYDAIFMVYFALLFVRENLQEPWETPVLKRVFGLTLLAAALAAGVATVLSMGGVGTEVMAEESTAGGSERVVTRFMIAAVASIIFALLAALVVLCARWHVVRRYVSFDILVVMGTLVLPQLVALPVRLILNADPLDYSAVGMWRTGPVLAILLLISLGSGLVWDWKKWLLCAGIFYAIYVFFFTTMFSNGHGLVTGVVGSLGYWIVQQGVERGGQPWYYYTLVQIPVYEYLPAIGALLAGWWVLLRARNTSGNQKRVVQANHREFRAIPFLGYWVVAALVVYTFAGEKMPWLTVHIALPMILASGWVFDKWFQRVDWTVLRSARGVTAVVLIMLSAISGFKLIWSLAGNNMAFRGTTLDELEASMGFMSAFVVLLGSLVWLFTLARKIGREKIGHVCGVVVLGMLGLFTLRTSIAANYVRYDSQTEFINYASGAPGIRVVMDQVEEISRRATDGLAIRVAYDDDVSWPFTWYLRDYPNQIFFGGEPTRDSFRGTPIVIAGNNNWSKVEAMLGNRYHSFEYIRMWWPMQDYFHLTLERVKENLLDPARRTALWDIWFRRDYTGYGEIHGMDFTASNWPVVDRMRFYVDKDLGAQLWNLGVGPTALSVPAEPDPYQLVTRTRAAVWVWGSPGGGPGEFNRPRDVAVGPDGFIYVADTFNHRIQKFDREGNYLLEWGSFGIVERDEDGEFGMLNEPWGLTVSDDGFVYVADTWNHRVQKFTVEGEPKLVWGQFGDKMELENMWGPRDVAVGPLGQVYVADTGNKRVSVFSAEGAPVRQIASGGVLDGELDEPVGLAVSDDGNLFVADAWNGRVQVFDTGGAYMRQWSSPGWYGQSLDNKPYLTLDDAGRVIASDPEGYRILVWDGIGTPVEVWGEYGSDVSAFDLPTGIAADGQGGLYVIDSGNNRVMYFAR